MFEAIVEFLASVAKVIADWHQRQIENARKSYSSWKAGYELRKDQRNHRARLLDSVDDKLRDDPKNQLPKI